jgi:hypothetical protein
MNTKLKFKQFKYETTIHTNRNTITIFLNMKHPPNKRIDQLKNIEQEKGKIV